MTWSNKWLYTPPAAATTAITGKVIASADWNTIHTDLSTALTQIGQQYVVLTAVNFNSSNTDNTVSIVFPSNMTTYLVDKVIITSASASLTSATCGVFTATAAGGTAIVTSGTAITVSTASANTLNNSQSLTVNNTGTQSYNLSTLYFRVQTAEGSAATGNVIFHLIFMP